MKDNNEKDNIGHLGYSDTWNRGTVCYQRYEQL